jgi:tetraacyldisaccharide 4'-kinase
VYGLGADLWNLTWNVGLVKPARCTVPVISVGGLAVGGSGKTPISAAVARHLADAGSRVAVLTAGFADELGVHAAANPDVHAAGGGNRTALALEAAHRGSTVVVLDSGFQHRRLHRDLDIVTMLVDYRGNRRRLPAGPFRDRFASLARADATVLVRRQAPPAAGTFLYDGLLRAFPHMHVATARILPSGLQPLTVAARDVATPNPEVAVAGIMWPEVFFGALQELGLSPGHKISLPDHAAVDRSTTMAIAERAGSGGVVCTGKDAVKLVASLPATVPIWSLMEHVSWEEGGDALLQGAVRIARLETGGPGGTR